MRTARFNFSLFFGFGLLTAASCTLAACSSGDDSFAADDSGADAKPKSDSGSDTSVPKADGGADTSTGPHDSSVPDTFVPPTDTGVPDSNVADTSIPDGGQSDSPVNPPDAGGSIIAKWSFEEGAGTTAADVSGHGKTATLMTGATFTTGGRVGGGLALDGATGYADIGSTLIDTSKPFTVACWVKLNVVNVWSVALSEDDVTGSLFGLKLRGDNTNQFDFDIEISDALNPGFQVAQSATTGTAGAWTHLVGVYDGAALNLYINGASEARTLFTPAPLAATGHFLIGRGLYNNQTGSFVNGVIDEVEVHNAALSSGDVAALYAAAFVDAGAPDSGTPDTGADTGSDAGTDSGAVDAGTDTGTADAGSDASTTDAGDASTD